MADITSITELRNDLLKVYDELRTGIMEKDMAKELANVAGKAIKTAQVQVAYFALRKGAPNINFLRDDGESKE